MSENESPENQTEELTAQSGEEKADELLEEELYADEDEDELMPPEEENEALYRLAENDLEARQTLVEHNLRLVVYIAKKFENTGVGIEDLISIGTIRAYEGNKHFQC